MNATAQQTLRNDIARDPRIGDDVRQPLLASSVAAQFGGSIVFKVLETADEIDTAFRFRYEEYIKLGYQQPNRSGFEIDQYDAFAIPFGAFTADTHEMVGCLRLITQQVQPFYQRHIHNILHTARDRVLSAQVLAPRKSLMPSIKTDLIEDMLAEYNRAGQQVEELSRIVIHPTYRRAGLARGITEFGLAYASSIGRPILIGSCLPEHVQIHAHLGFAVLPGTDVAPMGIVGQLASVVVLNTMRPLNAPQAERSRIYAMKAQIWESLDPAA